MAINKLLKKGALEWDATTQCTFKTLKNTLASAPILALPNFTVSFLVEVDALGVRVRAVIMQHDQLVAYFS